MSLVDATVDPSEEMLGTVTEDHHPINSLMLCERSDELFGRFEQELIRSFDPKDPIERVLVERVVLATSRLRQAALMEDQATMLDPAWSRYQSLADRNFRDALNQLERWRRNHQPSPERPQVQRPESARRSRARTEERSNAEPAPVDDTNRAEVPPMMVLPDQDPKGAFNIEVAVRETEERRPRAGEHHQRSDWERQRPLLKLTNAESKLHSFGLERMVESETPQEGLRPIRNPERVMTVHNRSPGGQADEDQSSPFCTSRIS